MNIIIYKKQYINNICGGWPNQSRARRNIWPPEILIRIFDSLQQTTNRTPGLALTIILGCTFTFKVIYTLTLRLTRQRFSNKLSQSVAYRHQQKEKSETLKYKYLLFNYNLLWLYYVFGFHKVRYNFPPASQNLADYTGSLRTWASQYVLRLLQRSRQPADKQTIIRSLIIQSL